MPLSQCLCPNACVTSNSTRTAQAPAEPSVSLQVQGLCGFCGTTNQIPMCTLRCSFLLLSGSPAPGVASPEAKDTGTCLRAASHPCGAGAPGSSHLSPLNQGSLSSFQRSCIMHYQLDSTKILRKTQENSCNIWWVLSATTNVTELLPVFSVAWWNCGRCAFPVKIHAAETTLHRFHIDSAPR